MFNLFKKEMKNVSIIFKERPEKWGLRGDPYFWDYLEKIFVNYNFPLEYSELEKIIKEEYLKLTGIEITNKSIGKCESFNDGGMSSGLISGEFWLTIAMPLLKDRLEKNNKKFNIG